MAATAELDKKDSKEFVFTDGFYHMGLLPHPGKALFPVPDPQNRGEMTNKEVDPWECWSNSKKTLSEKGIRLFIAKARQFFGLTINAHVPGARKTTGGAHFPSTNEYVEMGEEVTSRIAFPGGVMRLTAEEAKAVVKACFTHIIRYQNSVEDMAEPTARVEEIDLNFGKKPDFMTDEEYSKAKADDKAIVEDYKFSPKTDKYVADFVYFKKLEVDIDSIDPNEYRKNPNKYNFGFVGTVTKSFFKSPPKSVAEMYKNPGA